MATIAVRSFGTLLKIGDGGGSEVFTTIADITSISMGISLGTEEVTPHDGSGWVERIATILDGGEVSFSLNFNKAATQGFSTGVYADMAARTRRNFQIVLPTTVSSTGAFSGYVTGWNPTMEPDGVLTADLTIQVTAAVTWT